MWRISSVSNDDWTSLYTIEQAAHLVPWSLGTLKNNQGDRYLNLKLVLENGDTVAFAICQCVLDEATLFNIAVLPSEQGKGWAKHLLQALIEQLKTKGINTLWLEVRQSNVRAQALYQHFGFCEVDIRKNYYPNPDGSRESAVVMALYL